MASLFDNLEDDQRQSREHAAQELLGVLAQAHQYVGEVYSISYETALVQIHDSHRMQVGGIPGLCFLVATRLIPDATFDYAQEDSSIILLRVLDAAPLPNASEAERIRVEAAQRAAGELTHWDTQQFMDGYTANLLGYAGIRCRVIGTFYLQPGSDQDPADLRLRFGSDLSNYYPNRGLKVYKPNTSALARIVNFRDPDRVADHPLGQHEVTMGRVRYASTNRPLQGIDDVNISVAPADLLNMKTALFGMTRTGKSNTTKIMATAVFGLRYENTEQGRVGQIIFDYNGEYANENVQDQGALKNVWRRYQDGNSSDIVTYGTEPHANDPDRHLLKINFYADDMLPLGKLIIDEELREDAARSIQFAINFLNVSFDDRPSDDGSATTRFNRRVLAYRALLARAGFDVPLGLVPIARALFGRHLIQAMRESQHQNANQYQAAADVLEQASQGEMITWSQLGEAFVGLSDFMTRANSGYQDFESNYAANVSRTGQNWADQEFRSVIGMFGQRNGPARVARVRDRHDRAVEEDYAQAIISDLHSGRLVIVDQSLGDEAMNQIVADKIMEAIFRRHQHLFSHSQEPPEILVYIEEAHNLLPDGGDRNLRAIWPRVAKEGAKLKIGLVYATQEVSSVQKNILKNTANWFIGHLNNTDETRELKKYYDFEDFEPSIRRAQDRGFLRVKTLSNLYVVPVQVNRFEAEVS